MSSEKLIFVADKYVAELEKGDMMRIPFQVIRDLEIQKGDKLEFEFVKIADGNDFVKGFTVTKYEK